MALALTFLSSSACNRIDRIKGDFAQIVVLRNQLAEQLHYEGIDVRLINEEYLTVGIVNSPWKDLPADEKKTKAAGVARMAYQLFPGRAGLKEIIVAYVIHRSHLFGMFTYNDSRDGFSFSAPELFANQ